MRKIAYIFLLLLVAMAYTYATVPIDDVYHWPYDTTSKTSTTNTTNTTSNTSNTSTTTPDTICRTTVDFFDDWQTITSDTIVKAVIHRCQ